MVTVDEQGRMLDLRDCFGRERARESAMPAAPGKKNALVFSNFTPATTFGQPMISKMRLWFHSSRIDVRG